MRSFSVKSAMRLDVGVDGVERHRAVADGAERLDLVGGAARLLPEREQRRQRRRAVVGGAGEERVEDGAGSAQRGGGRLDLAEAELGRLLLQDAAAHHQVDRQVEEAALLHELDGQRRLRADDRGRGQRTGAARHRGQRLPPAQKQFPRLPWHRFVSRSVGFWRSCPHGGDFSARFVHCRLAWLLQQTDRWRGAVRASGCFVAGARRRTAGSVPLDAPAAIGVKSPGVYWCTA